MVGLTCCLPKDVSWEVKIIQKLDLTKEQKKKLAKRTGKAGWIIITAIIFFLFISVAFIIGYDEYSENWEYFIPAGCFVGIVVCIILILRKRKISAGVFNGTTDVYKVRAMVVISKNIRSETDNSFAYFRDDINYNPPKRESVIFGSTFDAEELYENITGEEPKKVRNVIEDVEVIIIMKGNYRRAFSTLAIE